MPGVAYTVSVLTLNVGVWIITKIIIYDNNALLVESHWKRQVLPKKLFFLLCRVYIPCIYILNKIDQISIEELDLIYRVPHAVPLSAHHKWNFDDLLEKTWEYLNLIRM